MQIDFGDSGGIDFGSDDACAEIDFGDGDAGAEIDWGNMDAAVDVVTFAYSFIML